MTQLGERLKFFFNVKCLKVGICGGKWEVL